MAMPTCLVTDLFVKTESRLCSNRLYWVPDTPPTTSTNMITLANNVMTLFAPLYVQLFTNNVFFQGVHARYTDPTVEIDGWSTSAPVAGVLSYIGNEPLPDEVCMEIQRRTGLTGRENRGRIFISGISSAWNDGGKITTAGQTLLIAIAAHVGPDQTFAPVGLCHARHYDRKANLLRGVSQARATNVFVSRRDRRRPLVLQPV